MPLSNWVKPSTYFWTRLLRTRLIQPQFSVARVDQAALRSLR